MIKEHLKPCTMDMLVGKDAMQKFNILRGWSILQSPFAKLPGNMVLDRLLEEWTTLRPE